MFYFRINKVRLFDNKTGKGILGLSKDKATVQLWSLIVTGNIDLPDLNELMKTTDIERRETIVREIVKTVAASRCLTPIDSVTDNGVIYFGDTGYVLFQSNDIPKDFNWEFTAIKLSDKTRDIGKEMVNVVNDKEFGTFANNLPAIIVKAANPAFTAAVEVGQFIARIVGTSLAHKKDKQLGLLYMSIDRVEHFPNGLRNSQDVPDTTGNMKVDYSIFAYDDQNASAQIV